MQAKHSVCSVTMYINVTKPIGIIPGGVEGSSHSGVSGGEAAGSGGSNILVEGGSALSRHQLG